MTHRAIAILALLTILFSVGACTKADTYHPVYYPDKGDLADSIRGPDFQTLEEARAWVYQKSDERSDPNWDYEIGKNCKPSDYGVDICEATLK